MRGDVRRFRMLEWAGDRPKVGDGFASANQRTYVLIEVREPRRRGKTLFVAVTVELGPADVPPARTFRVWPVRYSRASPVFTLGLKRA